MKWLFVLIGVSLAVGQSTEDNVCQKAQGSCSECIQASPECAWCADVEYSESNYRRCGTRKSQVERGCKDIQSPKSSSEATQDDEVRDRTANSKAIYLQPQKYDVKLRPGEEVTLDVKFRMPKDYPVDLYYLLDLSFSMYDDKEVAIKSGRSIVNYLRTLTGDVRIGFGAYVDKAAVPFVKRFLDGSGTQDSCPTSAKERGIPCGPAYPYRHSLSLTEDISMFERDLGKAEVAGNIDNPEGGLEALMQSVVCKEDIGWRKDARRIIIYVSDAPYHQAGDGRLAGIVKPADGDCYLDDTGLYTMSREMDYPSVPHLAQEISDNDVIVVFAVKKERLEIYQSLASSIPGALVAPLEANSADLEQRVLDTYTDITSSVLLQLSNDAVLTTNVTSDCVKKANSPECLASIKEVVDFKVKIKAEKCPDDGVLQRKLKIQAVGLPDTIDVTVTLQCNCNCQQNVAESDGRCEAGGKFVCGTCECPEGFYGEKCQCSTANDTDVNYATLCMKTVGGQMCTNRGRCVCGVCKCFDARYTGKYCECDTANCPYSNNKPCGGSERGLCQCDKTCKCNEGWTGKACECPTSKASCYTYDNKNNSQICNGRGNCTCGVCECEEPYIGAKCEDCPSCPGRCTDEESCVLCIVRGNDEECSKKCKHVKKVKEFPDSFYRKCELQNPDDKCRYEYRYRYRTGKEKLELAAQGDDAVADVYVLDEADCPRKVNILWIIIGIIAGIVFLGLLAILIYKLYTMWADRREMAKFLKETESPNFDTGENPLYKTPTQTFKNPMYQGAAK